MSFSFGFFNAKNMDRTYTAEDFTGYLSSIICNGVFDTYGDCFSVTAGSGTSVVIGTGKAWIDGHYFINDTAYTLDLSKYVDESLSRYVTIGISCDVSENVRACKLEVKSGTAATTPVIPTFEDTASKKFLTLAAVFLKGGTKTIANDNIFDIREDENKCGYVKCVLGKCRVSEILMALSVYRSTVADLTKQVQDLSSQVASLTTRLDDFTADVTAVGSIGDSAYYIMYSNGRLAIRGTGATYDYEIGDSPFFDNTEIMSLDVGEGITALGSSLFERCTNMTEISLPTTLTAIGERCFFMYSVGGLKSLIIPKNVNTIAEKAFVCCAIESVTIPFNVKEIGSYAFNDCEKLKSVYVESSLISSFMFTQCTSLTKLTISKNVKSINAYCINYCGSLKEITYEGTIDWFGRKKGFSANHAFSQMVYCADCCEQFRRIHWNNKGKKSIVWRCITRLNDKDKCRARTVSEETLKAAFIEALNEMVGNSKDYLSRLAENLEVALNMANPMSAETLSARMAELQQELINRTEHRENYDDITEEILRLRELQEQKGMDDAAQKEHTKRIKELQKFIRSQSSEITEFDEVLVRKLLEKVTVHSEYLEIRFKSGVTISVEK